MRSWALALAWLAACGPVARGPVPAKVAAVVRAPVITKPAPPPAPPPLAEAAARVILAARFRAAGLHIRQDVALALDGEVVVVDGYDGERQIGYEYVAPGDAPVSAAVRARAGGPPPRLLVVDGCDEPALGAAADHFLAGLAAP